MQSLEAASDEGERAVKRLKALRAAALPLASPKDDSQASCSDFDSRPPPKSSFDIFKELRRLQGDDTDYSSGDDSCADDNEFLNRTTKYKSLVLESLVKREKLNTVILNLYPGNKGYSLSFRLQNRSIMCFKESSEDIINTMARGYEEDTILRCIDNQEIPAFILEALDKFDFLFYSGCVIAEVRNYRLAYPENKCYTHHVLLRPTQKTLLADITTLTQDRSDLSNEDRDAIESQLVMAHAPDLCLDPDPILESRVAKIEARGRLWNAHPFRRMARKASQVAANRKRKLNHFAHRHGLELLEFCKAKKSRTSAQQQTTTSLSAKSNKAATLEEAQTVIPVPDLEGPALPPPTVPIVIKEFKPMAWPDDTSDCSPHLMEEYTLETDITSKDKDKPRVYHIKLSIFQRPANMEFLGELYLDRDHKKDQRNGVACRFSLGSRPNAHRYVRQFTEIFTESGRKTARISCGLVSSTRNDTQGVASRPVTTTAPSPQPPQQQQQQHQQQPVQQLPNPREQVERLAQRLQAQTQHSQPTQPVVNGIVQSIYPIQIQQTHVTQTSAQPQKSYAMTNQEKEIDALATKLEISSQEFQAAEKAKLQAAAAAQQQKLLSNSNIISLLNSSPASNVNSDTSAAVANAINNPSGVPQQRLLARKMTFSNVTAAGARVLSHGNFIALNNHNRVNLQDLNAQLSNAPAQTVTLAAAPVNNATRVNLSDLSAQLAASAQPQTVTLTSVNSSGGSYSYTAMPVKQQVVHHQRIVPSSPHSDGSDSSQSALGALLVGTPAADRPEIASPHQTNSLLLEKLAGSSTGGAGGQNPFAQPSKAPQATAQFVVQSPKGNTVISPMSSPPPQASNTLNVQSLNLTQLQSIPGLHNVQFQLQNFAQPISLALNVGGQLSGGAASQGQLLMSLPNAQTQHQTASAQASGAPQVQQVVMNTGGGAAGTSQLAHLVSSGSVKNITHHNLRTASGSQTLQLTQGSPQFQLISQLQRPARQQNNQTQGTIAGRTIQRPITIKMAPNSNQNPAGIEGVHYQQLRLGGVSQQRSLDSVFDKLRRSSND